RLPARLQVPRRPPGPEARSRPSRNRNLLHMRPFFGPRTVVEAAFLVAVPVIALEVGLRWYLIVVAGGIAYLLVLGVEAAVWRDGKRGAAAPAAHAPEPAVAEAEQHVLVIQKEPEPAPTPVPVHVAHE